MSKIVLWVSDLDGANQFYSALFAAEARDVSGDFHSVKSGDNEVLLHLLPAQYRELPSGSPSPVVREEVAIKPIFTVSAISHALERVADFNCKVIKSIEIYGDFQYQDLIDPEGNVIQIQAKR